jgi:hypothetical protein
VPVLVSSLYDPKEQLDQIAEFADGSPSPAGA